MFDIAKEAKLRPSDVARLLDLNRVTVSLWFNGHHRPHKLLISKVEKLLDGIKLAYEAGDLPVSSDLEGAERHTAIQRTLVKHLSAQKVEA